MTTALFTHPDCLDHLGPPGHPECPARLTAILRALDGAQFSSLERRQAPLASTELVAGAHPPAFIEEVHALIPEKGIARVDESTAASPGSWKAVLRAAGSVVAAVDAVMAGEVDNAFCAIRPPGHHAEPNRAMGFCLFNNVAIAAHHLRNAHGLTRIAAIDFDVHHGNGVQAFFETDADLFYGSTHESPLYPGTGRAAERGVAGNIVNVPLDPGSGSDEFRAGMAHILAEMERFSPEFVLVSAGFDAHRADPLATLCLTEDDYIWATREIMALAARQCQGRVVSALEGGYDLDALAASAAAHVETLMSE